jgi:hypothetical protein
MRSLTAAEAELHQAKLQASSSADQAFDHVLSLLGVIQRSNNRQTCRKQNRTAWNGSKSSAGYAEAQ